MENVERTEQKPEEVIYPICNPSRCNKTKIEYFKTEIPEPGWRRKKKVVWFCDGCLLRKLSDREKGIYLERLYLGRGWGKAHQRFGRTYRRKLGFPARLKHDRGDLAGEIK